MAALARSSVGLVGACMLAATFGAWLVHENWLPPAVVPAMPPSAAAIASPSLFAAFLEGLRRDAVLQGITPVTFDAAFSGMIPDPEVIELAGAQLEYVKTSGEYLSLLVSDARIEAGRQKLGEQATTLAAVERTYGVDRHVVLAIWGVESNYGTAMGSRATLRSLATLAAFDSRRLEFWRTELLAALHILQSGETTAENLSGSWAGAMGHTQFMPTTYAAHAVDFDRDGRRDIWASIPDALGSTGNYLKASGWAVGAPWGFEVRLPANFDYGLSNPGVANSWAQWQALGVEKTAGRSVAGAMPGLQLILPAGAMGPAFLVGDGFRAILKYNNSVSYALAVGHLADRLAGLPQLSTPWPAGDKSLGKAEREELQRRLAALGFEAGGVDGIIGNATKAAIRLFQKTRAMAADGHADLALLERLRQEEGR